MKRSKCPWKREIYARGIFAKKNSVNKKDESDRVKNSTRTGRKLKVEELPDLVSILEYKFGEGDTRARRGGGLESQPHVWEQFSNSFLF